ncbi:MAG: hypothetical protein HUU10_12070 [Bacteroidetes bacterium]|nr:hypothetical protein [Bacteroidota bacterium]
MESESCIRLECRSQLELDLLMELMNQYNLHPLGMHRLKSDGIEIILRVSDRINKPAFFGKLVLYEIYYTPYAN